MSCRGLLDLPPEVVQRVLDRHAATEYKRAPKPNYRSVRLDGARQSSGGAI